MQKTILINGAKPQNEAKTSNGLCYKLEKSRNFFLIENINTITMDMLLSLKTQTKH